MGRLPIPASLPADRRVIEAGGGWATVQRAETAQGVPNMLSRNLIAIREALEAGGIEFISDHGSSPGNGAGVRLRRR
jgi:hypothetical protein